MSAENPPRLGIAMKSSGFHSEAVGATVAFILIWHLAIVSAYARDPGDPCEIPPENVHFDKFHSLMLNEDVIYSVYLPPSYFNNPDRSYPVLYYIHGFDLKGQAYKDWENWRLDITMNRLIARGQIQEMIVIVPESFITGLIVNWGDAPSRPLAVAVAGFPFRATQGLFRSVVDYTYLGSFLFLSRWDIKHANYADFFTNEFIAYIEQKYRIRAGPSNRAITGFSTGGYSSLSLAFQHPELFNSVSAHAPMLVAVSPFSPKAGQFFVEYDHVHARSVPHRFVINLLKRIFQNEENWDRQNPLWLAKRQPIESLPVYLDVAEHDKRGYDIAACMLLRTLQERGAPVDFTLVRGLPPETSHTYPGYLNGRLIAECSEGKSDEEVSEMFHWKDVRKLLNPHVQQIEYSLRFHSRHFSE